MDALDARVWEEHVRLEILKILFRIHCGEFICAACFFHQVQSGQPFFVSSQFYPLWLNQKIKKVTHDVVVQRKLGVLQVWVHQRRIFGALC